MAVSHVYTAAEADECMPADTDPIVREAVRRILASLPEPTLVVKFPAKDTRPSLTLTVKFLPEMRENVLRNTRNCPWLTGILPRTHPWAYAALLTEAFNSGVTEVHVTSAWRPFQGSIAHRAGLGLDIKYAKDGKQEVKINRTWLIWPGPKPNANVTDEEKRLYTEYERAKKTERSRKDELGQLKSKLKRAKKPDERAQLEEAVQAAEATHTRAGLELVEAQKKWNDERDKNEPQLIRSLRDNLGKNKYVTQLLDPWYIDYNTQDKVPGVPNEQLSGVEQLHGTHLHITILEPKILP